MRGGEETAPAKPTGFWRTEGPVRCLLLLSVCFGGDKTERIPADVLTASYPTWLGRVHTRTAAWWLALGTSRESREGSIPVGKVGSHALAQNASCQQSTPLAGPLGANVIGAGDCKPAYRSWTERPRGQSALVFHLALRSAKGRAPPNPGTEPLRASFPSNNVGARKAQSWHRRAREPTPLPSSVERQTPRGMIYSNMTQPVFYLFIFLFLL